VSDGSLHAVAGKIEGAKIVRGKFRFRGELPCEHALIKSYAYDNADAAFLGDVQQFRGGLLIKDIINYLDAIDPALAHEIDYAILIKFRRGYTDQADQAFML
jgi:hypothetical protein